ncbi:unnamed protein product [Arabidopsis lyrata]|uniref:Predicted protein n=1 Tax=Arabidopsis lyrata subsp. lyrata TaxID=81972 RepID=D7LT00_ARALL|nr:predicted protein [Arabidopsis lyrata subsp. lyrata]CAH8268077.1 unnamed protein product [Arabidopsis lyrata]
MAVNGIMVQPRFKDGANVPLSMSPFTLLFELRLRMEKAYRAERIKRFKRIKQNKSGSSRSSGTSADQAECTPTNSDDHDSGYGDFRGEDDSVHATEETETKGSLPTIIDCVDCVGKRKVISEVRMVSDS